MKAVVQDRYGSEDVLRLREIETPEPGEGEVLVRVRAAGVDAGVWHLMAGVPYLVRVVGVGLRAPKNPVRGIDAAGLVEAVGEGVTGFGPGDEVFGSCRGAFAEYACGRAELLAPKPEKVTFEQAAAVAVSGGTALQAVRDRAAVRPGQRVLVIGAGGGVGTFAVQLAKAFGAEVTGVCSTAKIDLVRSLGADTVIDYTREDALDGAARYDAIVDTAGNRPVSRLRRALTPKGTLVIVGGESDGRWLGGLGRPLRAHALSMFVGQKLGTFVSSQRPEDLETLRELIVAGTLTPVVDRTFPLDELPDAIRYLRAGRARGKVVVTV